MESGTAPEPLETSITFRQWATGWLTRRRAKDSTYEQYDIAVRVHLNPRWGSYRLQRIRKAEVESWVQEMEGNPKLANSTADGHWTVFKMILKDALLNGKITSNPTYDVDGPYVGASPHYVFTPDEFWEFYDEFPKRYRVIPAIGFGCGTRQAEAFGVADDVIDRESGLLTVRRQVLRTKETSYRPTLVERLKTSPRLNEKTVPIPPWLMESIDEHQELVPPRKVEAVLWEHKRKIADVGRGTASALFWTPRGGLLDRNHFNDDIWKPTLRKVGIKDEKGELPTFHDLRHTFISMCLQAGIPEHTVAAWVGDSVEEIRRTYSHLLKNHAETHGAVAAALTARPAPDAP
ncbi:tyrosine-type recombinase/integrase [Streptomyces sp. NPDC048650]|uniref:tyrosine-type recombinase/integrase n=1 Tax=Streptomyces sp. NPDC048650 TaxID=3365583 RepID=UPI0037174B0F